MNTLPSIELLESTHRFPCPYVLKAIGRAEGGFVGRVVAAVRDQLEADVDPPYRFRSTKAGRHVAVTMEPVIQSAKPTGCDPWALVYGRIRDVAGLVFLL